MKVKRICKKCRKEFQVLITPNSKKGTGTYCSRECKGMGWKSDGKNNPRWNGGIKIHDCGYILIASPSHPFRDKQGYVREHKLVMEAHLGRYLSKDELVHHKNHNKTDNRIENLELTTRSEHKKKYHPEIGMSTRFIKGQRYNNI